MSAPTFAASRLHCPPGWTPTALGAARRQVGTKHAVERIRCVGSTHARRPSIVTTVALAAEPNEGARS